MSRLQVVTWFCSPTLPIAASPAKLKTARRAKGSKSLIRSFEMPKDMGLICRTASCVATPEMLIAEANDLLHNVANDHGKFQEVERSDASVR